MAVSDIVGLAGKGEKTAPAKKRGSGGRGKSRVNPDLDAAMAGGGGRCVGCNNPQGENKSAGNHRAEKMDAGLPLGPIRNGE